MQHVPQGHLRGYRFEIGFNYLVQVHHGEYRLILIVGDQGADSGEFPGIYGVGHGISGNQEGYGSRNHQGHKQFIAPGNLGNQEYCCQRGVDNPGDQSGHANQGKVRFTDFYAQAQVVQYFGKDVPQGTTHDHGGNKNSTCTPCGEGSRHRNGLEKCDTGKQGNDYPNIVDIGVKGSNPQGLPVIPLEQMIDKTKTFPV